MRTRKRLAGMVAALLGFVLLPAVSGAMPVPDVLQLHMDEPLWDGTPNEVVDSSGMGHHGTIVGDPTIAPGYFQRAGSFDGNDKVNCGSASTLVPTNQISMEAWIKPDPVGTWGADRIILARNNSYYFEITADKRIRSLVYFPDSPAHSGWLYGSDLSTYGDEWLHVVTTYDGTVATGNHAIWVNGQQVGVQDAGVHNIKTRVPLQETHIGSVDGGRFFKGQLDEVGIYSSVLTEQEIKAHYNTAPLPDILDLRMNELKWTGAADEVTDYSGWNHHGSAVGNAAPTAGYVERGGAFDGVSDWVDCGTDNSLVPGSAAITIDAWIKPNWDKWVQSGTIATREHSYYLQVEPDGRPAFLCYSQSGGNKWIYGPDLRDYDDEWIHIAGTWDGTTERLYVNGETQPGWSGALAGTGFRDFDDPTQVGCMKGNRDFVGAIDEVGIFSRTLSEREIQLRAATAPSLVPDLLDLQMNEAAWSGAPNEVLDTSGWNHHGQAVGNAQVVDSGHSLLGGCGSFGGTSDYVDCGYDATDPIVPKGREITIDAWIKPDFSSAWTEDGGIVVKERTYYFQVQKDGRLAAILYNPPGGSWLYGPDMHDYAGEWVHVAVTCDGTYDRLWVNGETMPGWSILSKGGLFYDDGNPTQIGSMKGSRDFRGLIDNVGIYSRALSREEIRARAMVPEPATIGLLGAALLALARRRKR